MSTPRRLYIGPSLRRIRRDLGLTQADMASDLEVSASYIALLERNHRPLSAEMLLRLAHTYRLDVATLAGEATSDINDRLQSALKDPMFADIDLPPLENADLTTNFPGVTEAFLRLYSAWRQEHQALADRNVGGDGDGLADPVAESRRFLAAHRNFFPALDDAAETLSRGVAEAGGLEAYLAARHGLRTRRMPSDVMVGSVRRYDLHRREVLLDDSLDAAGRQFQLATQIVWLDLKGQIDAAMADGVFATEDGGRLSRRALAAYAAAALVMPYGAFARAAETRRYDVEGLARQFGASFEQVAHRLTTLQKPGQERVPFFFIRVDAAGNVSKRLDGARVDFARQGGACPLWSVHTAFRTPREIVTQWLELPDGQKFFSIARTVTAGGGAYGAARVERAVALVCAAEQAHRLVYSGGATDAPTTTPIGVACRLCHRAECMARAAPPIGRALAVDDIRRPETPFAFADA